MEYKVLIISLFLSVIACSEKTKKEKGTTAEYLEMLNTDPTQASTAYLDDPDNIKMK